MLRINSNQRTNLSDPSHDFVYQSSDVFSGSYELMACHIPNTFYNVNNNNNKIYFYEDGTEKVATLTNGNYDSSTLLTEIETVMDIASGGHNTYTVTYSSLTAKYTFSAGNAFHFTFGSNQTASAYKLLGFDRFDTVSGTSVTSSSFVDLTYSSYFNIRLNGESEILDSKGGATMTIPITGNSGSITYYESSLAFPQRWTADNNVRRLRIEVLDDDSQPCDLNGSTWSFILKKVWDSEL